jgi:hypothetical protein
MEEPFSRISRQEIDDVLFHALMAVYRFEWDKIKRIRPGLHGDPGLADLKSPIALADLRVSALVTIYGLPFSSATRAFSRL